MQGDAERVPIPLTQHTSLREGSPNASGHTPLSTVDDRLSFLRQLCHIHLSDDEVSVLAQIIKHPEVQSRIHGPADPRTSSSLPMEDNTPREDYTNPVPQVTHNNDENESLFDIRSIVQPESIHEGTQIYSNQMFGRLNSPAWHHNDSMASTWGDNMSNHLSETGSSRIRGKGRSSKS